MKKEARKASASKDTLNVPMIEVKKMRLTLVGDSALICHRFAEKAQKMMLDKQMGAPKQAKEAKDPDQCYRDSLYEIPGKPGTYGFPSVAFKSAAVDACSSVDGMKKTTTRGAFHIVGDMVEIDGQPKMRQDTVRIAMGTADIRFRGEFREWRCQLEIRYNARMINPAQIINLFNTAGFAIGVGEWRPQRDGSFGMFHVDKKFEA